MAPQPVTPARLLEGVVRPAGESTRGVGLLVLRLATSAAVFGAHALPKLGEMASGQGHFPELVAEMGFPAPMLFAWMATLAQAGGAILIALGLLTRLGALAVLSTLLVGVIGVHWGDPFPVIEAGVAYIAALTAISLLGAGRLSLDHVLLERLRPSEPSV